MASTTPRRGNRQCLDRDFEPHDDTVDRANARSCSHPSRLRADAPSRHDRSRTCAGSVQDAKSVGLSRITVLAAGTVLMARTAGLSLQAEPIADLPRAGAAARIEQERDCNRVSFHEQHARPAGGSPTAISPAIVRKPREVRNGHHPGARAGLGRSSPLWRRRALHEEATRGSVKCFPDQCKANKSMTLYYKVKVGSWGSWRPLFSRAQRRRRTAAISCTPSLTTLKNATAMPY